MDKSDRSFHQNERGWRRVKPTTPSRSNRAAVLIVAIGVLTVLAVLGVFFANMTTIERRIARANVDMVRAQLLAHSGIEYAISQINMSDSTLLQRMAYWGEDWNADGANSVVPVSGYPNNGNGLTERVNGNEGIKGNAALDVYECSPEFALRPSFLYDSNSDGFPDLVTVSERDVARRRGYSGMLPSTYQQNAPQNPGNTFSVRVINQNAKIDINSLNPHIASIINNLAASLGLTTTTLGNAILATRTPPPNPPLKAPAVTINPQTRLPRGGYSSTNDRVLLDAIAAISPQARLDYDRLKNYLTVSSQTWVDTTVIRPKPQQALPTIGRPTSKQTDAVWYADFNANNIFQGPVRYDYDFELQPRAPIDINAAPRPVLVAVLQGLAARVFVVVPRGQVFTLGPPAEVFYEGYVTRDTTAINSIQAGQIADAIVSFRRGLTTINFLGNAASTGPFTTWEQFDAFVDQRLIAAGIVSLEQGQVIKANANPNSRLAKFNSDDPARLGWVVPAGVYTGTECYAYLDKSDLLNLAPSAGLAPYTTEFCFSSGGCYEIDSFGRVLDGNAEVVATSRIRTVVRAFETVRHTTERDFAVNANSAASARFGYHPETLGDVSSAGMNIRTGAPDTGSDLDGQIANAPVWGAFPAPERYFRYWERRDSTEDPYNCPSSSFAQSPMAWRSKEINDFSSGTPRRTLFGRFLGALGAYPNTDPFRFSDLTHDGLFHGADRYRNNMFSTLGIGSGQQNGNPRRGTLEFWVKPRGMLMPATAGGVSTRQAKGLAIMKFLWNTVTLPTVRRNASGTYQTPIDVTYPQGGISSGWRLTCYTCEMSVPLLGSSPSYGVYCDIVFIPKWTSNNLVTATRGASPQGAQHFGNAFLRIVLPYTSMAAPFKPGQWHHIAVRWETTSESLPFGNLGNQNFTYMGGDLFVDGVKATTKHLWAGQTVNGIFRTPPWHLGGLCWQFATRRYGNLGNVGAWFRPLTQVVASGNDSQDLFGECTTDEVYIYDNALPDNAIQNPNLGRQRRYFAISSDAPTAGPNNTTDPRFFGAIRRKDSSHYDPSSTGYNNYAQDPMKVLPESIRGTIRIRSVAATQYRPARDYMWTTANPNNIPEANRPRWRIAMKKSSEANYNTAVVQTTGSLWFGDERRLEDILPAASAATLRTLFTTAPPADPLAERFQYRLFPTAGGTGVGYSRVTPFFEDITLTYTVGDGFVRYLAWEHVPD